MDSPSGFSLVGLFDRPLFDEDYDFGEVAQQWQFVLGLVLLGAFCATWFCRKTEWFCAGSVPQAWQASIQFRSTLWSVGTLLESCGLFLLLFAMLKHSPQHAVLVVFVYFFFPCFFDLVKVLCVKPQSEKNIPRLPPVSVYTDLHAGNLFECLAMLAVQLMLYCLVAMTVFGLDKVEDFTDQQVFFYMCGALVSTVLRIRAHSFEHSEYLPFWEPYFQEFFNSDHWPKLRLFCSLLVNEFLSQSVLILLPLILMESTDLMEFVKDATCVAFISEMDNLRNVEDDQVMVNEQLTTEKQMAKFQDQLTNAISQKVAAALQPVLDAEARISQLSQDLANAETRLSQKVKDVEAKVQEVEDKIQAMVLAARTELSQLSQDVADAETRLSQKVKDVEAKVQEVQGKIQAVLDAEARIPQLSQDVADAEKRLSQKVQDAEAKVQEVEDKIQAMVLAAMTELSEAQKGIQRQVDYVMKRNSRRIEELQGQHHELAKQVNSHENTLHHLTQ